MKINYKFRTELTTAPTVEEMTEGDYFYIEGLDKKGAGMWNIRRLLKNKGTDDKGFFSWDQTDSNGKPNRDHRYNTCKIVPLSKVEGEQLWKKLNER